MTEWHAIPNNVLLLHYHTKEALQFLWQKYLYANEHQSIILILISNIQNDTNINFNSFILLAQRTLKTHLNDGFIQFATNLIPPKQKDSQLQILCLLFVRIKPCDKIQKPHLHTFHFVPFKYQWTKPKIKCFIYTKYAPNTVISVHGLIYLVVSRLRIVVGKSVPNPHQKAGITQNTIQNDDDG